MKPTHRTTNVSGLLPGGPGYREGRRQRQIRRALLGMDGKPVTTRQMLEACFPRKDLSSTQPEWLWACVRRSAEKYAERVWPRTRPLRWRLKPDALER
jgi:hypothetical protein